MPSTEDSAEQDKRMTFTEDIMSTGERMLSTEDSKGAVDKNAM